MFLETRIGLKTAYDVLLMNKTLDCPKAENMQIDFLIVEIAEYRNPVTIMLSIINESHVHHSPRED